MHTPGPWSYNRIQYDFAICPIDSPDEGRSLIEGTFTEPDQDMDANGRLLAAAPDLLGALQLMLQLFEHMAPYVGKMALPDYALLNQAPRDAQAAIARVTG